MKRFSLLTALIFVIAVTACSTAPVEALFGSIPRFYVEVSRALFGSPKVMELKDGRIAVQISAPADKDKTFVAMSYAGSPAQILKNPLIGDAQPSEAKMQNVKTDERVDRYAPVGFSTATNVNFGAGMLAGGLAFLCVDFGAGLVRNAVTPMITSAVKASAVRIPERSAEQLLRATLSSGGKLTIDDLEQLARSKLITPESAALLGDELRAGRGITFEADAIRSPQFLSQALESSPRVDLEIASQLIGTERGLSTAVSTGRSVFGAGRVGTVVMRDGGLTMELHWVPQINMADLKPTAKTYEQLAKNWSGFVGSGSGLSEHLSATRAQIRGAMEKLGWCSIQVDWTTDRMIAAAQEAYQNAAKTDSFWLRFQNSRSAEDFQSWVGSPGHPNAIAAARSAVQRSEADPRIATQVAGNVAAYVEMSESAAAPVVRSIEIPVPNIVKPQIVNEIPKLGAGIQPKNVPLLPANTATSLALNSQFSRAPLLLTASEVMEIPLTGVLRKTGSLVTGSGSVLGGIEYIVK